MAVGLSAGTCVEELVVVLLDDDLASGIDDVTGILDELPALWREGGNIDGRIMENVLEHSIDLPVRRHLGVSEGLDETHKLDLRREISEMNGDKWGV